ncbi:MAG: CotH kinase family protein, partial [Phycisphaerales bacterium JB063]
MSDSPAPNTRTIRPAPFERLEPRLLFTAVPIITEFLASNSDGLTDEDGDSSDWLEIYNAGDTALDLAGWHLTDDAAELDKWAFPAVSLDAGEYLLVFASNKDRADADGTELHTNFALSAGGDYLALVQADGSTVAFEYAPEYPEQSSDVSYGISTDATNATLVSSNAPLSYLVPTNNTLGTAWTQASFNDNAWTTGSGAIGYETNPGSSPNYSALIDTDLGSSTAGAYIRYEFNVADPAAFSALTLRAMYDDGFVAYLNGTRVESDLAPNGTLSFDSTALSDRADALVVDGFVSFDLSDELGLLQSGTNVLAIHSLNVTPSSSDLLFIPELVASVASIPTPYTYGFFDTPTPAAANGQAFDGFVEDTKFSVDRGLFTSAFSLEITTETPGAMTVYTTDGTAPAVDDNLNILNGTQYTGAIQISATTNVRAAAFKLGFRATNVDTQTYIFVDSVLNQSSSIAGFPSSWGSRAADYEMDPNVVNNPSYADDVLAGLSSLPSVSLTLDIADMFGSNGIYSNTGTRGDAWERPTSIEWIDTDGSGLSFQADAGVQIQGSASRNPNYPKHSFRLVFKDEYGDTKLREPVFGDGVDVFDTLSLRANFNDAWPGDPPGIIDANRKLFIRDTFSRETQAAMGQPAARGQFVHLYINGLYWGLYDVTERPDESFAEELFGGDKDTDYDVVKASGNSGEPIDTEAGDLVAWNQLFSLVDNAANNGSVSASEYQSILPLLDVEALIDYMLVIFYTGNRDAPVLVGNDTQPRNFLAIRDRRPGGNGFQFYVYDAEFSLGVTGDQNIDRTGIEGIQNPARLFQKLMLNEDFKQLFQDRVQTHFFNGGALSVEATTARFNEIASRVALAMADESARWGDVYEGSSGTKTTDDWHNELDRLRNTWFPVRTQIVLNQFISRGWLSTTHDAPSFSQQGGLIPPGSTLTITNNEASGTIYYTIDGSDPRLPGGGINSSAIQYTGPFELPGPVQTIRARLFLTGTWSAQIAAEFSNGAPTPEQEHLRITELHYNPQGQNSSELAAGFTDGDQFEFIELLNTSATQTLDLAGVSFGDGVDAVFTGATQTLLSPNFDAGLGGFVFINNAFNATSQNGATAGQRDATGGVGGSGALRIDLLSADNGPDHGPTSAAYTRQISLAQAGQVTLSFDYRLLFGGGFEDTEIGQAIVELDGVRLGNDVDGSLKSYVGDGNDGPAFDSGWAHFSITLDLEAGAHTLTLGGYYNRSTYENEGVTTWFDNLNVSTAGPVPLAPGERALLVSDLAAFTQRYGQAAVDSVAAIIEYTGNLSNSGENIK